MATKRRKKRVGIRDVAEEAGVSRSTVSLVLNNSTVPKAETRRKVLEVVKRLKYRPDPLFGQAMRRHHSGESVGHSRTQTIGFFARDFLIDQARSNDGYYSRTLAGIQRAAGEHDYHLMIKTATPDEVAPPAMVTENRVDGLVVEGDLPNLLLNLLVDRTPIALVDRIAEGLEVDSVMPNIEHAVCAQLAYLWDLGHRDIVKFTSKDGAIHQSWYERAFYRFFEARGHSLANAGLCERREVQTATHHEAMARYAKQIVEASPRPTALITWDIYACSLLPLLQGHGLRVPEDISLIGMDDTLDAQVATPQLTTFRFSMEDMGHVATEMLLERIEDRGRPVRQVTVNGKLIERATCAAPPDASTD